MKYLYLVIWILSLTMSTLGCPSLIFAQDDGDAAPILDQTLPADEMAPPSEVLSEDDAINLKVQGPDVDDSYNSAPAGRSIWNDIHLGPTVQIGLPHPLTYGVEGLFDKIISFGFSTGAYQITAIDKAEIDISSWDIFARWHPFAGSFFLGGAYGHQSIEGVFEDKIDVTLSGVPSKVPARVDIDMSSSYFSPRLGWFAVWDSGFTLGFELGAQIPLSPKSTVDATIVGYTAAEVAAVKATEDYKDLKKNADDAAKTLGKQTLPYISLLKVGWLF